MSAPKHRATNQGFTVVETLIVLAIAGLILLIILLAIPVLQRASRNNQRKQDVQAILEAVSRYELNNGGKFPDDCGDIAGLGQASCTSSGGSTVNDYFLKFSKDDLTFYTDPGQVKLRSLPSGTAGYRFVTDAGGVAIFNHQKCFPNSGQSWSRGAGFHDVVALYAIETGSGTASQCQQL